MYLLYFALWVIFNGNITLEICLFGIVIAGLIFAFTCKFMDYSMLFCYFIVLIREIVKANFAVVRIILSQKEEIQPALVSFHSDLKTSVGKAFLANAITLTPGTITVTLEDSGYVVHCLDEELAVGMAESVFVERLTELEKK